MAHLCFLCRIKIWFDLKVGHPHQFGVWLNDYWIIQSQIRNSEFRHCNRNMMQLIRTFPRIPQTRFVNTAGTMLAVFSPSEALKTSRIISALPSKGAPNNFTPSILWNQSYPTIMLALIPNICSRENAPRSFGQLQLILIRRSHKGHTEIHHRGAGTRKRSSYTARNRLISSITHFSAELNAQRQ